jgi:hypothetical protein
MNKNSALFWLPIVEGLGIRSPKTKIIPYDHNEFVAFLEGETKKLPDQLAGQMINACEEIGWPSFIRTDLSSCKHNGPKDYLATDISRVRHVMARTVEDNEIKFWLGPETPQAFLVRQYLHLKYDFTAFNGLPISREFRYFSDGKLLLCSHPYWPEMALEGHIDNDQQWKEKLAPLHSIPTEFDELTEIAIKVAQACNDSWSIDFAQDENGDWWLIDMALMKDSWHWPGCKNSPTPERRKK